MTPSGLKSKKWNIYGLPQVSVIAYLLFNWHEDTWVEYYATGREDVLRDKGKAREMYLEVQTEIQKCIAYLKDKREKDPYRNLLARLAYQAYHGFSSQVPTFDIWSNLCVVGEQFEVHMYMCCVWFNKFISLLCVNNRVYCMNRNKMSWIMINQTF